MKNSFLITISNQITRLSKFILLGITLTTSVILIDCGSSEMVEGKAFFQAKGCTECHSVSTFGLESQNKSGPDLADAYTDVQKRFGTSLENFLKNPTGTMQMVLTTKIKLTDDEKFKVIELLKYAHENKPSN